MSISYNNEEITTEKLKQLVENSNANNEIKEIDLIIVARDKAKNESDPITIKYKILPNVIKGSISPNNPAPN